jgi:hypothetical protein
LESELSVYGGWIRELFVGVGKVPLPIKQDPGPESLLKLKFGLEARIQQ